MTYHASPTAVVVFLSFVAAVLAISFHLGARARSAKGYFAAHGEIGWVVNGVAFAGDYLSAASFLGICGMIAFYGYDGFLYSIGYLAGWVVALFVIAEPIKRLGKFTFADALDSRYGSRTIKLAAAISTLVVSVFYLIPQMVGAGALCTPLLGLSHRWGVVIVGIVVLLIVVTAGMVSTTWVQFIKGSLLVVFCGMLTIAILARGFRVTADRKALAPIEAGRPVDVPAGGHVVGIDGGLESTGPLGPIEFLSRVNGVRVAQWQVTPGPGGSKLYTPVEEEVRDLMVAGGSPTFKGVRSPRLADKLDFISLMLALFAGTASLPHILIRYYTVKDAASARKSTVVGIASIGFFYVMTLYLGLGAMTSGVLDPTNSNMAAPLLARSFGELPFAMISAIAFTTVLGTVSGLIMAASGAVAHDLMENVLGMRLDERAKVRSAKWVAVAVGAVGMVLGILFEKLNVTFLVGWAFNVAASANLPSLVMLLFWRRTTRQGIAAAILAGMVSSLAWLLLSGPAYQYVYRLDPSRALAPFSQPGLVTIPLGFVVLVVVSLMTRKRASPSSVPTTVALLLLLTSAVPAAATAAPGERVLRTAEYRELQERLARGWNTWNTMSVLSHVHLPEGFAITIGLKSAGAGPHYQRDFFQANETLRRPERIRLGPHADDGSYTELSLEWGSGGWAPDTPNVCLVQSATEGDEVFVLVTVKQRARRRPAHLHAEAGFLWNRPGRVTRSGEALRAEAGGRVFEVRSTARDVGDPFGATGSPYLSAELDGVLALYSGPTRTLDEIQAIVARRRTEHAARLAAWGEQREIFTAMQTILAWNTVWEPENGRVVSPVSRLWNANWGGYVLFDWDTYFAAFMFSLYDEGLAHANAVEVTKGWTRRGFVPNFASAYHLKSEDRSQPPVGSLMALEIHRRHGKRWFLEEVYEELLAWNRWWPGARECRGLLCWGSDEEVVPLDGSGHTWQAALYESGLDNSPMYDGVPFDEKTNRLQIADVGLTSLYVADCRALAEIAGILGHETDARELRARGGRFAEALGGLWDERAGIYLNRRTDTGEASPKLSPTNFYPLIAKAPSAAQAERMAKEHYFNPAEFHGEWVIPSIARDVSGFADQSYWRGRIWGPMNFLVYLGLRNYELPEARADLARRSAALLLKSWRSEGAIYENYNALSGAGNDVTSSDAFYHWGALLGVISLLEDGAADRKHAGWLTSP